MKKNQNQMISEKLIIYKTSTMKRGIVKIPSYLVDMVLLEGKVLMIKIGEKIVSKFNKENMESYIKTIESHLYDGILYQQNIKYNLVQVRLEIKKNITQTKQASL